MVFEGVTEEDNPFRLEMDNDDEEDDDDDIDTSQSLSTSICNQFSPYGQFFEAFYPPNDDHFRALDSMQILIITHILKKNMQITGNHQMARIVRHNDESVREGYIRNGGKEVKLFTSALKAFQCNNRIVMAQRNYLDDFLRGRIIGRLECGRTQLEVSEEHGIAQRVISRLWQRFQDDGNVSRCYSTGRPRVTTPNEDRYLAVTAKRNRRSTTSDLSLQLPVRQFQGKPCTED
ncbi:hypothetical protein AVEN_155383-1 [Araneus ventricosus]|uniref:Paired domain-containing protein n=1 Tax=Araneus ventricosus TaxID=182803 RepID=A0A4Y2TA23_ARAVE|nr:hypothetical protein AVEN_24709-1 [Araneus ventricosus]GBN96623.1 hypothetical protein AVEN_155383-1 [Araneus ventricosus]